MAEFIFSMTQELHDDTVPLPFCHDSCRRIKRQPSTLSDI